MQSGYNTYTQQQGFPTASTSSYALQSTAPTTYYTQPTTTSYTTTPYDSTYAAASQSQYGTMLQPANNTLLTGGNLDNPALNPAKNQLELQKRMLENDRETQLKYADMESDRQKKLEDRAEKQREKAAKWKARSANFMVHRHEKKATTLELKAHEHYIASEQYKLEGKKFEEQRKVLEPEKEKDHDKDDKSKSGKPGDKKDDKKDEKKDDKKPEGPKVEKKPEGPKVEEKKVEEKKDGSKVEQKKEIKEDGSKKETTKIDASKGSSHHNAQGQPMNAAV